MWYGFYYVILEETLTGQKPRILIVDDEEINIQVMDAALRYAYDIDTACCGFDAIRTAKECVPDLILLDVAMPDIDGFEVCKTLKADETLAHIPIIFLTAMDSVECETKGLEAGGIDYLTKPLNIDLVRLRVKNHIEAKKQFTAILPNRSQNEQPFWRIAETASKLYTPNGVAVNLTSHEFILLRLLIVTLGKNVTYQEIFNALGHDNDIYARARLEVLISRLRAKVQNADPNSMIPIKARRNIGYIFLVESPSDPE